MSYSTSFIGQAIRRLLKARPHVLMKHVPQTRVNTTYDISINMHILFKA